MIIFLNILYTYNNLIMELTQMNDLCQEISSLNFNNKKITFDKNSTIQSQITLLKHCLNCRQESQSDTNINEFQNNVIFSSEKCNFKKCFKMKNYLHHRNICKRYIENKNCIICLKINTILIHHARRCFDEKCKIIHCKEIKQKFTEMLEK